MEDGEKRRELCERLDYRFRDPRLLAEALRHPSWRVNKEHLSLKSYQRLEFLGDRVVELISAERLLRELPDATEGELTTAKSFLVNNQRLAELARKLGLGECLSVSSGARHIREDSYALACALEALFGAIFFDSGGGYLKIKQILERHLFAEVDFQNLTDLKREVDPKGWLQGLAQEKFKSTPQYALVGFQRGTFTVSVLVHGIALASGQGKSRKEAEKEAAATALRETADLTANVPFSLSKHRDIVTEVQFRRG